MIKSFNQQKMVDSSAAAIASSVLLIISEVLPFVTGNKVQGIVHGLTLIVKKLHQRQTTMIPGQIEA